MRAVMDHLGLPQEAVLDLPLLTLVGRQELTLENHLGIKQYSPRMVKVRVKGGFLEIRGGRPYAQKPHQGEPHPGRQNRLPGF